MYDIMQIQNNLKQTGKIKMKNYNNQNNPEDGKDQSSAWDLNAIELDEVINRDSETEQNDGRIDDIDKAWLMAKAEDPYREQNIFAREQIDKVYGGNKAYNNNRYGKGGDYTYAPTKEVAQKVEDIFNEGETVGRGNFYDSSLSGKRELEKGVHEREDHQNDDVYYGSKKDVLAQYAKDASKAIQEAQKQSEIAGENYDAAKNGTETYEERIHREKKEAGEKVRAERQAEISKQNDILDDIKTQHKQKGLAGRFFSKVSGNYGRQVKKQKKVIKNI